MTFTSLESLFFFSLESLTRLLGHNIWQDSRDTNERRGAGGRETK